MTFANEVYKNKINDRIRKLVNRHERYLKNTKEATSKKNVANVAAMQEGLFLIEDELCFLLSFLKDDEMKYFRNVSNVQWTDEIEFQNNRPRLKIPLA
ncbi:hypothetical protein [Bacillus sp. RIT 809]|uniref:hypothetical protein n=1 Tax=Bacillus sp. RIT 809 TaxID=2803857 RepID=UPI00194F57E3|nr:hypothetical protein [Bacillus sp. RIT 809]MBM6649012.1 hypothetical protein [Bacillus sp. RIT 809]